MEAIMPKEKKSFADKSNLLVVEAEDQDYCFIDIYQSNDAPV